MIESHFDVPFTARMALKEKQIQQNFRPVIAVHKWFARRPGSLFRSLLLAEFRGDGSPHTYYASHNLAGIRVGDPFMGGGTPMFEANRLGCDVLGCDINPMAHWIVRQELASLDLEDYAREANSLRSDLEDRIGDLYRTRCCKCGDESAHAKYFLWVKAMPCTRCGEEIRLFPGYLVAADSRHPQNVFVCRDCGELTEAKSRQSPGSCRSCGTALASAGRAQRGKVDCPHCRHPNRFPRPEGGPLAHHLFAIEYWCPTCKEAHDGRFFKRPDKDDMERVAEASRRLQETPGRFIPKDEIPDGDETGRLHRWGYRFYREMFNDRQLLGLSLAAELLTQVASRTVREALATNLSDLLRYQNLLCRYDTTALKSLDIFSVHGFPVGLVQCESNMMGIVSGNPGTCVGSGGWANIVDKYAKAKAFCNAPFEFRFRDGRKTKVPIAGETIGTTGSRTTDLRCADAAALRLEPGSLDAVLTDPPYFGNVQYAELMDFCYVWLRQLGQSAETPLLADSTRHSEELTGNEVMGRGPAHFAQGLSAVFRNFAGALKPGAPFAFTYHHNELAAYRPLVVALLDAGLVCSASLPCPGEMGASIHISGTASSIVDTVFVCRSTGRTARRLIVDDLQSLARLVEDDLQQLLAGDVNPTLGDARCLLFGHLTRLAIWNLRGAWTRESRTEERLDRVDKWFAEFVDWQACLARIEGSMATLAMPLFHVREREVPYDDCLPF